MQQIPTKTSGNPIPRRLSTAGKGSLLALFAFLTSLGFSANTFAQYIKASNGGAVFGNVLETSSDSTLIWLRNPTANPVSLTGAKYYPIYGSYAFSSPDTNRTIPANDSIRIKVKFKPVHNINNLSTIVLKNNGGRGTTALAVRGICNYSKTYYSSSFGLAENALKTALKTTITANYNSLGYNNAARDQMFMSIDNKRVNGQGASVNTIECIYTGRQVIGYADRTAAQGINGAVFNTEHTFPQFFFNQNEPMRSDLFHLFPTSSNANNSRNNFPFGIATQPYSDVAVNASSKLGANSVYMPRDSQKAVAARALLYFVTRYNDYAGFVAPQEAILRTWAKQFPVNAIDRKRNDDIFSVQRNRNPFIDYPQFLDRITSVSTTNGGSNIIAADMPESTISFGNVANGVPEVYSFVVVNSGNTLLTLSNAALQVTTGSGTLAFAGGSDNSVGLFPGEAKTYLVSLTSATAGALTGNLTFTTNLPSASVTVPITANILTGLPAGGTTFRYQDPQLYPNPTSSGFNLSSPDFAGVTVLLDVLSGTGRTVLTGRYTFDASGNLSTAVNNLAAGLYHVRIRVGGYTKSYRLIKN